MAIFILKSVAAYRARVGKGKGLNIHYNPLNLPRTIETDDGDILIWYDAAGQKVKKTVDAPNHSTAYTKEYINGVEYKDGDLEGIYFGDGRIVKDETYNPLTGNFDEKYRYEFTITDHLGNARVSFSDLDDNGFISISDDPNTEEEEPTEILQENHYYPFGMNMEGGWIPQTGPKNQYQYNGKELDEDFGLNWYHYGFRIYDPAICRFTSVDPIADQFYWVSPFNYAENEPIANIDLHGLQKLSAFIAGKLKQQTSNGTNTSNIAGRASWDIGNNNSIGIEGNIDGNIGFGITYNDSEGLKSGIINNPGLVEDINSKIENGNGLKVPDFIASMGLEKTKESWTELENIEDLNSDEGKYNVLIKGILGDVQKLIESGNLDVFYSYDGEVAAGKNEDGSTNVRKFTHTYRLVPTDNFSIGNLNKDGYNFEGSIIVIYTDQSCQKNCKD